MQDYLRYKYYMQIKNIHSDWGSIIELNSPEEFFNQDSNFWRNMIYNRKLIFFKKVNFTQEQYAEFSLYFGKPWEFNDYSYSQEHARPIDTAKGSLVISPFNTKIIKKERVGMSEMPWHADIPNRFYKPFPFRSLWITQNPNPNNSGKTKWLNLEKAVEKLTPELKDLASRMAVVQQSWYEPGTDIQEHSFLKIHPITGKQSLRLNWFCRPNRTDAWIKNIKIDGVVQPDNSVLNDYFNYLSQFGDLYYEHVWDTLDISIYDNWSFVHRRSKLNFDGNTEYREFLRINIDHCSEEEWLLHVNEHINESN